MELVWAQFLRVTADVLFSEQAVMIPKAEDLTLSKFMDTDFCLSPVGS